KTKTSDRKADTKAHAPRRRTRMIALEPRMLFDGALGLDLSAQATAVAMGDASVKADATVTPAAPEAPSREPAAPSSEPAAAAPATFVASDVQKDSDRPVIDGIAPTA